MIGRLVLTLALALATTRVAAADIHYVAPAGCPTEADVASQLEALRGSELALTIEPDATGFRGALTVPEGTREVTGATCDETVAALVLVALLAVEQRAAPRPAPPPRVVEPRWRWWVGAGVARYEGMTPTPIVGVPLHLAASRGRAQLRLTFDATGSDQLAMTTFRWTAGRIEACYAVATGRLELAPCGGVQAGVLTGSGTNVDQAASDTRPWVAPELAARAALRIGPAALEVEATAAAPLVRDRYYIAPSTTVHQVPAVAFGVGTDLAMRFR